MQPKDYLPEPRSVKVSDDGDSVTLEYKELVGIQNRTIYGLDKVFHHGVGNDGSLHGATHTGMVAVTQDEYDRRLEEFKDYEYSPVAHIYDEQDTKKSWDEWVSESLRYDAPDIIVEMAGPGYFDEAIELADEYLDVDAEFAEVISGGRLSTDLHREWDVVFRPDLIALAKDAESDHPVWPKVLDTDV